MGDKRRAYMREYQRKWYSDRRAAYFADKSCVKCSTTENLELDHIDPATKITSAIWSWSKSRQEAELAKCQVLCSSCHWEKTKEQTLRKRYCTNGHDTAVTGRDNEFRCIQCRREIEYPRFNSKRSGK